jgi:hypothetical protein
MAEHIEPKAPLSTFDKPDAAPGVPMAHADGGPGLGTLEGVNDSAPDSSGWAVPNTPSEDPHQGPQVGPTPQAHQRSRWWLGALIVVVMGATGFYAWRWYALPRTGAPMELALPPGDAALLPDAVRVVTPAGGFAESPEADAPEAPPSETGAPAHPVAVPPPAVALPALGDSDALALSTLQALAASLAPWLVSEDFVQTFVVTVDNLTAQKLPPHRRLVKPLGGNFLVLHDTGSLHIDPANAARYAPVVNALTAIDPARVAERYRELYPLVQQAWVELGNTESYFNDRLIAVLDHLTAATPPTEPVALVQPKVFYRYADAVLEGESVGRRALFRLGAEQMRRVQIWLGALRKALATSTP